jgi:LemA protein
VSHGQNILFAVAALLVFWGVGAYNRLVRLRGAAVAVWAPIDAQLRRRQALAFELAGLLAPQPAMDDAVGRATLQALAAATRQAQAAADHALVRPSRAEAIQSLGLAEQVLEAALRPLRALIESREAQLEGDETGPRAQALLQALREAETQLAFARGLFNEAVEAFNAAVHELPTRLLARRFGFQPAATLPSAAPERSADAQGVLPFGDPA